MITNHLKCNLSYASRQTVNISFPREVSNTNIPLNPGGNKRKLGRPSIFLPILSFLSIPLARVAVVPLTPNLEQEHSSRGRCVQGGHSATHWDRRQQIAPLPDQRPQPPMLATDNQGQRNTEINIVE